MTDPGRTVYGGGGITPDEKIESPKSNDFQDQLLYKSAFFHFAPALSGQSHCGQELPGGRCGPEAEFKQFLTSQNIPWTDADLNGVMDWVKVNIKQDIVTSQFGQLQGLRAMAEWDPMIQKALGLPAGSSGTGKTPPTKCWLRRRRLGMMGPRVLQRNHSRFAASGMHQNKRPSPIGWPSILESATSGWLLPPQLSG